MKADSTIRQELRALRKFIDSPDSDPLAKRIAYEIEQAIRWAREDVKGWPRPLQWATSAASIIRQDVRTEKVNAQS